MTRFARTIAHICALAVLPACTAFSSPLTISAAISLKEALNDAGHQFEAKTGDQLTFNFLASGPLMKQIEEGAPVDLFVSAAHKQMDELRADGLIDPASERIIAKGELVLIVPSDEKDAPSAFAQLRDPRFNRIAIGDPSSVPAGDYAMQTLRALKLEDAVASRLEKTANVRQVLDYVERGEVDAGIVYRTDALSSNGKVKIVATADESTHQPIEYPAAIIKSSSEQAEAQRFLEFLSSPAGQQALVAHGFAPAK